MSDKPVVCLNIPDDYEFMDLDLIDEFRAVGARFFGTINTLNVRCQCAAVT